MGFRLKLNGALGAPSKFPTWNAGFPILALLPIQSKFFANHPPSINTITIHNAIQEGGAAYGVAKVATVEI